MALFFKRNAFALLVCITTPSVVLASSLRKIKELFFSGMKIFPVMIVIPYYQLTHCEDLITKIVVGKEGWIV